MFGKPAKIHLVSVTAVIVVAVVLLVTIFPYLARLVFPPTARRFTGLRLESLYYLTLALIPVVVWLIPPLVRALARGSYSVQGAILGRSGFYVRFPRKRELRFRDTVVMSLGPFAIDLLVIAEIEFFFATPDLLALGRGFIAVPALLVLAGVITALVPGPWTPWTSVLSTRRRARSSGRPRCSRACSARSVRWHSSSASSRPSIRSTIRMNRAS